MNQVTGNEIIDPSWKNLYKIGGAAALLVALFVPIQIVVFIISPPPGTVIGWFTLFQDNWLLGLLDMDLLLIIDQLLTGLALLALFIVLRQTRKAFMAIALVVALLGIASYFASNVAFNMLSLSNQYAAAATEAEKAVFLSAGQTMLIIWTGTAYDIGYVLLGAAFLITGVVMLRSSLFNKATAWVGIILGVLSLVPASAGTIGKIFAFGSLLPMVIWYILIGLRLIKYGRSG
jgi:hypothetical protein